MKDSQKAFWVGLPGWMWWIRVADRCDHINMALDVNSGPLSQTRTCCNRPDSRTRLRTREIRWPDKGVSTSGARTTSAPVTWTRI